MPPTNPHDQLLRELTNMMEGQAKVEKKKKATLLLAKAAGLVFALALSSALVWVFLTALTDLGVMGPVSILVAVKLAVPILVLMNMAPPTIHIKHKSM